MTRTFHFADGELDDVRCPRCGVELLVTEPEPNDDGDLVEFAFCPVCIETPEARCIKLPKALLKADG